MPARKIQEHHQRVHDISVQSLWTKENIEQKEDVDKSKPNAVIWVTRNN